MLNPMGKGSLDLYKRVVAKRILLVDDSAMVRAALRAMLEDEIGWAVCAESRGWQASRRHGTRT